MSTPLPDPKRKRKAKRRLLKIRVGELSLVDKHCVPSASFLIAKRLQEPSNEPVEVPVLRLERANESVAQAFLDATNKLKKVAGQMNPSDLEMLARMIQHTQARFGQVPTVAAAELTKGSTMARKLNPEEVASLRELDHRMKTIAHKLKTAETATAIIGFTNRLEQTSDRLASLHAQLGGPRAQFRYRLGIT